MSAAPIPGTTPVLGRLVRRYRSAQAVRWMACVATPLLAAAAILHVGRLLWSGLDTGAAPVVLAAAALAAWVPFYLHRRASRLSIAHEADALLGARGAVTAAAELTLAGGPRTPWGAAAVRAGARVLGGADVRALVPRGRFVPLIAPLAAGLVAAVTAAFPLVMPPKQVIAQPDPPGPETFAAAPLFNPADEKMLERVHEKLRARLETLPERTGDEKVDRLRRRIEKALSTFPETEESYRSFMQEVEGIRSDLDDLVVEKQEQEELLEQLGGAIDADLLEQLGEALETGDTEQAAETAEQLAEQFEEDHPEGSAMGEAGEDLLSALSELETEQPGEASAEESEQAPEAGDAPGEDEPMDPGQLAELLSALDALAGMLGIEDAESLPEGLEKLGEKLSELDASGDQLEQLEEMVEGLDNLQNLMNGAGQQGKESYQELRDAFENEAQGQPGQPGGASGEGAQGGQGGAGPQGGQPGGASGEGAQGGQGGAGPQGSQPGGGVPGGPGDGRVPGEGPGEQGGDGQGAGSEPGGVDGEGMEGSSSAEDGEGQGQEGHGTGTAGELGDAISAGEGVSYEDVEVEGEDNPGPVKKDVIQGASDEGFVDQDYEAVYEQYSSILQDILEGEEVPSIYRFYVDKYFELIAPRSVEQ
jgi:hypothetical protein